MTNELEKQFFDTFGIEPIERKACNSFPCSNPRKSCENCNKLYKTLTEIKEIAEKNLNIHTCAFTGCGYDLITKQILQKISECEGNDGK